LEAGKVDTRRVNASGRWSFFWGVMPKTDPVLLLKMTALPTPLPRLPKLRSLETGFMTLPGGPSHYIRLRDPAQVEIFETLCRDVVASAEKAEAEALTRAIGRTFRWHHLLRGGRLDRLSDEEQKGLIGELAILDRLIDLVGAKGALSSWTGPAGAPKDFELHGHCIEVKARRIAAQPWVQISNEFRLEDVPDHRLWLAVIAVDKVEDPFGETLTEIVAQVGERILALNQGLMLEWEMTLADAGFHEEDDYSDRRWVRAAAQWHVVSAGFPRLAAPVPNGVSNVKYALSLQAASAFLVESTEVEHQIAEGHPHV